jgi:hypothetical protein
MTPEECKYKCIHLFYLFVVVAVAYYNLSSCSFYCSFVVVLHFLREQASATLRPTESSGQLHLEHHTESAGQLDSSNSAVERPTELSEVENRTESSGQLDSSKSAVASSSSQLEHRSESSGQLDSSKSAVASSSSQVEHRSESSGQLDSSKSAVERPFESSGQVQLEHQADNTNSTKSLLQGIIHDVSLQFDGTKNADVQRVLQKLSTSEQPTLVELNSFKLFFDAILQSQISLNRLVADTGVIRPLSPVVPVNSSAEILTTAEGMYFMSGLEFFDNVVSFFFYNLCSLFFVSFLWTFPSIRNRY